MGERIKVGNYEFLPSKYIEMLFENGAADSISAIALTAPQNAPVTSYLPYYIKSTQTAVIDDNMGIITFPISDVSGYSKAQLFIDGNPIDISPENIAVGKDHITVYNEHGDSVTGILLYDLQFVNDYLIDSAKQLGQLGDILISLYGNDRNKLAKKVKLISKLLTRHRKAEALLGIINIILDLPVAPVDGKILRMSDNLEIVYYDAGEYIVIDKGSYSAPLTNHIAAQNGMTVKLGQPLTNLVELQQRFGELRLFIDPSVARLDYSLSSSFEEILGAYRSYSYCGNDFRMPKPLDEKPNSSDFQGAFYLNKYALARLTSPIGFAFSYRFVQSKITKNVYNLNRQNAYIRTELSASIISQTLNRYVVSRPVYTVYNKTREQMYINSKIVADVQFNSYKFIRAYMEYTVQNTDLQNKFVCADIEAPIDASMLLYIYSRIKNYAYNLDRSKAYTRAVIQMNLKNMDAYTFAKMQTDTKATKPKYIYTALIGDVLNGSLSDRFAAVYIREDIADFTSYYTYASIVAGAVARGPDRYVASNITSDITTKYIPFWYEYDEKNNPAALWVRLPDEYVDSNANSQTLKIGLSEVEAQDINYNDPKKVFDFFTDFESLNELKMYGQRKKAYITHEAFSSDINFKTVDSNFNILDPYEVNFTEERFHNTLIDSSTPLPRLFRLNLLSEEESLPSITSIVVTEGANDVQPSQISIDQTTSIKNSGLFKPLKVSDLLYTQEARLIFRSLSSGATGSRILFFWFKARPGTTWSFTTEAPSSFSGSITADGSWQLVRISGSFSTPFLLKIKNTSLPQTIETFWIGMFMLISGSIYYYDMPYALVPTLPSIVPLASERSETFKARLSRPLKNQQAGTIFMRINHNIPYYTNTTTLLVSMYNDDKTVTFGANTYYYSSSVPRGVVTFNVPAGVSVAQSDYRKNIACSWQYNSLLDTTTLNAYSDTSKSTTAINGTINFGSGFTTIEILGYNYREYIPMPVAELYYFDRMLSDAEIAELCTKPLSLTNLKPTYKGSVLYTQSKGWALLPLGFDASEGVIGTTKVCNQFNDLTYELVAWPSLVSNLPSNNSHEAYVYPASKKALIAYGGSPANLSYSCDLTYFSNWGAFPIKKWINAYFQFLPELQASENKYVYESFWWNSDMKTLIKAWDIKPNPTETTALVIKDTLSDGTLDKTPSGGIVTDSNSIKMQNYATSPNFSGVPSDATWNYSNVSSVSVVDGALRITPKPDSFLSGPIPKGVEVSFPVYNQDFVLETAIGIPPNMTSPMGSVGVHFLDNSNNKVGFAGIYDSQAGDYPQTTASIKSQSWSSGRANRSQVKIRVERTAGYGNVWLDDTKVLSNIAWPDNIVKIIFANTWYPDYPNSPYYYPYMDIKYLYTDPPIQTASVSATRISPEYSVAISTKPSSSSITWLEEIIADDYTLEVYTNVFDGTDWLGWKQCTNGGQIPDMNLDTLDWPNVKIQTKQVLYLPESPSGASYYLTISDVVLTFNTAEPEQINTFVKPLNKVLIGWPEGTGQAYTDYIGVAKADPINLSYKLKKDCIYVKIDGKLTKQRVIRIPYQYICTLDKKNALVGFCKPEEWEAAT